MEQQSIIIFGGIKYSLKEFIVHLDLEDDEIKKLFIACAEDDEYEIIRSIENGVDINYKTKNGYTPLLFEIKRYYRKNNNIVEILLKNGVDINVIDNDNGYNCLIYACERNDIELVKLLVNYGIDINFQNSNMGDTALMEVCMNCWYDIACFLLEKGANPNIQTKFGYTALMNSLEACELSYEPGIKIIKLLIKFGANVNLQNYAGNTALMWFIEYYAGSYENNDDDKDIIYGTFKYLLECNYNLYITNKDGNNLLIFAVSDINFMKIILHYLDQH